jgi:hypothetical protein
MPRGGIRLTALVAVVALVVLYFAQPAHDGVDRRAAPQPAAAPGKPASALDPTSDGVLSAEPAPPPEPRGVGTVVGTVRYEDGTPAAGLRIMVGGSSTWHRIGDDGSFRFESVRAHPWHRLTLDTVDVAHFPLAAGEEQRFDIVVPRGGVLRGIVVTKEDGAAAKRCPVLVSADEWGEVASRLTREDGTFEVGWVPGGRWVLRVIPDRSTHQSIVVECPVRGRDVDVRVELESARPLPLRFENLPPEWREEMPLVPWLHDRGGRLLSLPPSNAIGWPGGEWSTSLDPLGQPKNRIASPAPGVYTVAMVQTTPHSPYHGIPWLMLPVNIPEDMQAEVVIRIPDGARVTVVSPQPLRELAIGPARAYGDDGAPPRYTFPRVPSGDHAIWEVGRLHMVRVGEITVPAGGDFRHELAPTGTAQLSGEASLPLELRRTADDLIVARKWTGGVRFQFPHLSAGRYVLATRESRVPVELVEGQALDVGVVR